MLQSNQSQQWKKTWSIFGIVRTETSNTEWTWLSYRNENYESDQQIWSILHENFEVSLF